MQDPFFGFGHFNQGGFGGGQPRGIRRVGVGKDSPTQLSTLDSRFQAMLGTMEPPMNWITHPRFHDHDDDDDDDDDDDYDDDDDSPPSPPSKTDSYKETKSINIGVPPNAPPNNGFYRPPVPRAKPPNIPGGYYGGGFYPPRYDPPGGNPVNVHVHVHMMPQEAYPPPGSPFYGGPQVAPPFPPPPLVWPRQPAPPLPPPLPVWSLQPSSGNYQIGDQNF